MNKQFIALAIAVAVATPLAGCSSGGGDDPAPNPNGDANVGGGGGSTDLPTRPSGPRAPGGGGAPTGETKAGNYFGTIGFGDGVFVVDANNELSGLVLNSDDSSAQSFFGNVGDESSFSGTFRTYEHSASNPPASGGFGTGPTGDEEPQFTGAYTLNFVPGQTIEGNETSLVFADGVGRIAPATIATVAGNWQGVNQFANCDDAAAGDACQLVFDVTFSGATVSGNTSVRLGDGSSARVSPITGEIEEFGDTLLLTFTWDDVGGNGVANAYQGIAFFPDNTGRLVFLGETLDAGAGNPTLASLLVKQQ